MRDSAYSICYSDNITGWDTQIRALYLSVYGEKKPTEAESLTRLMKSPALYGVIAKRGGSLAGFILLLASPDSSDILEICVHPDMRRLRIGKGLLEAGLFQARQRRQNSIILEVAEDNLAAQTLYHRAGFKQTSRRPNYYLRGAAHIDALVMEKQLFGSSKNQPLTAEQP